MIKKKGPKLTIRYFLFLFPACKPKLFMPLSNSSIKVHVTQLPKTLQDEIWKYTQTPFPDFPTYVLLLVHVCWCKVECKVSIRQYEVNTHCHHHQTCTRCENCRTRYAIKTKISTFHGNPWSVKAVPLSNRITQIEHELTQKYSP